MEFPLYSLRRRNVRKGYTVQDRELNNLNNITCLLACLLRCVKAHIRKVCDLQRALNTNQYPSQSLSNLFRPRSLATFNPER